MYVFAGFYLAEMGLDPWEIDRLALEAGFPQGPLHVYGTAGGNVIYHAGLFMKSRKPEVFSLPETLIKMYEAGYVGAGKPCFYKSGLEPDSSAREYIVPSTSMPTPDKNEVKEMLLLAMVNQAFRCWMRRYYEIILLWILGPYLGSAFLTAGMVLPGMSVRRV